MKAQSHESGQIVIEYVLILAITVTIATVIVSQLVGQGDEPGSVIRSWNGILTTIAQDMPERVTTEE